jgi:membrane associated rhomboid family serine protease/Zn-finger nucleic acid-binding protein
MLTCPKCTSALQRTKNEIGSFWRCPACEGRTVSVPLLRKTIVKDYIDLLWLRVRKGQGIPGRECPACYAPMSEVSRSSDAKAPQLDICPGCRLIWFDPKEYEEILTHSKERPLTQKEKEFINLNQAVVTRDMWLKEWSLDAPEEGWKYLPAMFGIPVEYEETLFQRNPWLTRLFVFLIVIIFGYDHRSLDDAILHAGLIPADAWRYGGLSFLTSLFLHSGLLHLFCNAYFFYTFGDNVEDYLGRWRYTLLILASSFAGNLLQIAASPHSQTPFVGANFVITGLMVFYVLRFPKAQMGLLLLVRSFRWFRLPAFEALIAWILIQAIAARFHISGFANVSLSAHLASAVTACGFWMLWRKK